MKVWIVKNELLSVSDFPEDDGQGASLTSSPLQRVGFGGQALGFGR